MRAPDFAKQRRLLAENGSFGCTQLMSGFGKALSVTPPDGQKYRVRETPLLPRFLFSKADIPMGTR